mmetsp:Transcript_159531/g.488164  ORF Transcript_159531/g.488164 Transcript_159531/m.488164 type:complete len:242 (+) Transcript_159531:881-1606(+)
MPQVGAEGRLQVFVQAPCLVLQGVEVGEDVRQAPETASAVGVGQFEQVREERLAVGHEQVDCLLAMLHGLSREQVQGEGVQHQPSQQAVLRGAELRHGAGQHGGLVLAIPSRDGALQDPRQGPLRERPAEQQLLDVGRPHVERCVRVLDGLHRARGAGHQQPPVDGRVEAADPFRWEWLCALVEPLHQAEASGEPPLRVLDRPPGGAAVGPPGRILAGERGEARRVLAHELQPPRHWLRQG